MQLAYVGDAAVRGEVRVQVSEVLRGHSRLVVAPELDQGIGQHRICRDDPGREPFRALREREPAGEVVT